MADQTFELYTGSATGTQIDIAAAKVAAMEETLSGTAATIPSSAAVKNYVDSKSVDTESTIYDISEANNGTTYANLAAALNNGNNIPASIRKGGISIKFIQSSDNKYVQCRYMSSSTAVADFTNVANWQGVDEEPITGSHNLIESGGVAALVDNSDNLSVGKVLNGNYIVGEYDSNASTDGNIGFRVVIPRNQNIRIFKYIRFAKTFNTKNIITKGNIVIFDKDGDNYTARKIIGFSGTVDLFGLTFYELNEQVELKANQCYGVYDSEVESFKFYYKTVGNGDGDYMRTWGSGTIVVDNTYTFGAATDKSFVIAIPSYKAITDIFQLNEDLNDAKYIDKRDTWINAGTYGTVTISEDECYLNTQIRLEPPSNLYWRTSSGYNSAIINRLGNFGGKIRVKSNVEGFSFYLTILKYIDSKTIENKDVNTLNDNKIVQYLGNQRITNDWREIELPISAGCLLLCSYSTTSFSTKQDLIDAISIEAPITNRSSDDIQQVLGGISDSISDNEYVQKRDTWVNEGIQQKIEISEDECYLNSEIRPGVNQGVWITGNANANKRSLVINRLGNIGGRMRITNNLSFQLECSVLKYVNPYYIWSKNGTALGSNRIDGFTVQANGIRDINLPINAGCLTIYINANSSVTKADLISNIKIYAPVTDRTTDNIRDFLAKEKTMWEKHPETDGILYTHVNNTQVSSGFGHPQFLILTDNHASETHLKDAVSIANGCSTIKAIVNLGDTLGVSVNETYNTIVEKYRSLCRVPIFTILGNHDNGNSNLVVKCGSNKIRYEKLIKPMVDSGLLLSGQYVENKCYWYKDLTYRISNTSYYKVRIIGLNDGENPETDGTGGTIDYFDKTYWTPIQFDPTAQEMEAKSYVVGDKINVKVGGLLYDNYTFQCVQNCTISSTWENSPKFKLTAGTVQYSKEQLDWLCTTLNSTPSDHSIVILKHQVFSPNAIAQTDKKFCQANLPRLARANNLYSFVETDIIGDILRAYSDKANLNVNVVYKDSASSVFNILGEEGNKYAYNISFDFANSNGAKIACILGGHTHQDCIYKLDEFWNIISTCSSNSTGNTMIGSADIRFGKYDNGSFTVVTLKPNKLLLAKVGCIYTDDGRVRQNEIIDTSSN